jgi:hypothetical protein
VKDEREFSDPSDLPWDEDPASPGVSQRILSADGAVILTRLARWRPGLDTSPGGVIRHDYVEEVYLLEGELTDLTLGQTFTAGSYACRPPGMPHGPYRTSPGCTMLEIRTRP